MEFSPESSVPTTSYSHTVSVADDVKTQHKHQFFNPVTPDISPPRPLQQLGMNTKMYAGSEAYQQSQESAMNISSVTSVDIQEMEKVRQHLHSMLKSSRSFTESEDSNHGQSTTENEGQDYRDDQESVSSIETAALIQKLLPNSSPLSEIQLPNGQMTIKPSEQRMAVPNTTTQPHERKVKFNPAVVSGDKTLVSENILLKEHLDREKFRRKHCEQQIQQLHGKLLEVQQQLAVAVSTDRKKEVMIEQLDKTLAKVVEGWKKHEEEKMAVIEKLKQETQASEDSHQRQQEFEKELSQAVEALTREQERAAQAEKDKHAELNKQKEEHKKLLGLLSKEKEKVQEEQEEKEQLAREKEQAQHKYIQAQDALEKQNQMCKELEKKMERLEKEYKTSLDTEKENVEHERQSAKDTQSALDSLQKEVQRLEMELDAAVREKESLKMEINLIEARYDATKSKLDTERQGELERQFNSRLEELQEQMNNSDAELRESHRKQIQEVNKKHKEELQQQLTTFHEELKKKDARIKATTFECEERVSAAQEQIASISIARQRLENQRMSLTTRLQNMMKSHCEEALGLLGTTAGSESGRLSPTFSSIMQVPGTKTSSISSMEDLSDSFPKRPNNGFGVDLLGGNSVSSQHRYNSSTHDSYSYPASAVTTSSANTFLHPTPNNNLLHPRNSSDSSANGFQGTQAHTSGYMHMTRRDVISDTLQTTGRSQEEGSYVSGSSEFQPLKAYYDTDEQSSVISGRHDVQLDGGYGSMEPLGDQHSNVVSSGGSPGESNHTLLEQDLDNTLLDTINSTFPNIQHYNGPPQYPLSSSDDLKEKIIAQETRQAELNHYVKMLLQKSPGQPLEGENVDDSVTLIPIPRSGEALPSNTGQVSSGYSAPRYDAVSGSNSVTKDVTNQTLRNHPAFVKTKVASSFKGNMASNPSQVAGEPQLAAKTPRGFQPQYQPSTHPFTPPRRDTETERKTAQPNTPGMLSPEQLAQLSRLLNMYNGDKTKVDQPMAEQLFSYLRDVQNNEGVNSHSTLLSNAPSHQQASTTNHVHDGTRGGPPEPTNGRRGPLEPTNDRRGQRLSSQSHSLTQPRARKMLDSQFVHKKQVQERTQGPSITGLPIQAPHCQNMHGRQQKSTGKQGVVAPGPPQRQESWSKPGPRPQDGKGEKRPGAGAKQTKGLAWR